MFREPDVKDLKRHLHDLLAVTKHEDGASQILCIPKPNILRQMTLGIQQIHLEIAAASKFGGNGIVSESHSDAAGKLKVTSSLPLLGKRFRLLDVLGEGTLSQIFKAGDVRGSACVAIKVMRAGFHVLGLRETGFLRYFNAKTQRGSKHCKCYVTDQFYSFSQF